MGIEYWSIETIYACIERERENGICNIHHEYEMNMMHPHNLDGLPTGTHVSWRNSGLPPFYEQPQTPSAKQGMASPAWPRSATSQQQLHWQCCWASSGKPFPGLTWGLGIKITFEPYGTTDFRFFFSGKVQYGAVFNIYLLGVGVTNFNLYPPGVLGSEDG